MHYPCSPPRKPHRFASWRNQSPELPKDYGTLDVQGVVRLKVIFLASGKIGDVVVVSQLTKELSELAAAAAKKIKFEPKMVDGVPVTVARIVEYPYSEENGGWGGSKQSSTLRREPLLLGTL